MSQQVNNKESDKINYEEVQPFIDDVAVLPEVKTVKGLPDDKLKQKINGRKKSNGSDSDKENKEPDPQIGYFQLYRYATSFDYFLIFAGSVSAAIHGAALPLMFIIFGDLTNSFVGFGRFSACNFDQMQCNILYNGSYANLTQQQFMALLNEELGGADLNNSIQMFAVWFSLIAVGVWIFGGLQVTCWLLQAVRQTKKIRINFFRSILRQEVGFFDVNAAGELNTRMADDISKIQNGIADKVSMAIMNVFRTVTGLIIGFIYSWQLALVVLACAPLLAASAAILFKVTANFTKKELDAYAKAGAIAEEVISSIRTVAAFDGQEKEIKRYANNLDEARRVGIRKGFINGLSFGSLFLIMFSTYGLAFWYGSTLVFDGVLPGVGSLLTSFFGVLIGAFSLGQAASNVEDFAAAQAAGYKVFEIIDREPSIDSMSEKGHKPERIVGEVQFKNVDFTYPARTDVQVLHNVNFTADSGKTTALCGQSGCGKSTCVQLIQRFYDPQSGSVEVDGQDIRTLNVRWLREHIGVVSQEPILFDTTIAENIRYGRENVTDAEIQEAIRKANAYDFINKLPKKLETMVGEGGVQMSGGQKQRIAIARAIVRDPKILLLDEATSALDTESEGIVQAALEKASQGRTTVVIAHRLSTIKNSNKIIGFNEGRAVEEGNHEELLKVENGVYQNLVHMQSYHADEGAGGEGAVVAKDAYNKTNLQRLLSATSVKSNPKIEEETEKDEDLPEYSFWEIARLNKPELCYIIIGCFAAAVNGGVQPVFAILFSGIIEVFADPRFTQEQRDRVVLFSLIFVAIGVATLIASILQQSSFAKSGEELTSRLRLMGFRAILRQEMGYFDDHKNSTGALTTRLATDASKVQGATGVRLGTAIQNILALGVALGIAFAFGWELTLLTLAFVPFIGLAGMIQFQVLTGQTAQESKAYEEAGKIAVEGTINIRTVASLTKENLFYNNYAKAIDLPYRKSLKKAYMYGITFGFSQCIIFFAYAAVFRFGAWLAEERRTDFDDVFRVLMAVIFGAFAVGQTSSFAPDYAEAKVAAARMLKLFHRKPAIDCYSKEGNTPKQCDGSVDFQKLKFTYPTRPDVLVLKGLTTMVRPGQTLALVGQSGCGKSTCIQLLERFYDPDEGSIVLDKEVTKDLQISWLRSQLGIVSQEPVLFDCTIAENITYGDNSRDVSMEEVIAAAKKANIHDFINQLPEAYKTNVGAKGTQLSGGQKQRVAIARALIRNPKVLLLDEATSALDAESEKIVQDALDHAREGRTCIVIAHRLSTVKNADAIAVIENGSIVEMGTHAQLLAVEGSYFSLVNAQLHKRE